MADHDQPGLTVKEALTHLDPPIPRRTLERRLVENCKPLPGKRKPHGRGRPASVYRAEDVYTQHTAWAKSQVGKRPPRTTEENT